MAKRTPGEIAQSKRYAAALEYAARMHAGQVRMGGMPYIVHPVAVADIVNRWGYGEDHVIAAFFHDLLEDTEATEDEISALGGPTVLEAVRALTKEPGYAMADYVAGVKANDVARVVTAADRIHNPRCAVFAPTSRPRSRPRCATSRGPGSTRWPSSRSTTRPWAPGAPSDAARRRAPAAAPLNNRCCRRM